MRHLRTLLTVLLAAALLVPASAGAEPSENDLDVAMVSLAVATIDGPAAAGALPVVDGETATDGGTPAGGAPEAETAADAAGATGATGTPGITPAPAPEPAAAPGAADGSVASAATRDADASGDVPLPLVLLGVLALLVLLLALLWALARFLAYDPPWLQAGRHATGEAGWRVSASWAEFADWLRIGR